MGLEMGAPIENMWSFLFEDFYLFSSLILVLLLEYSEFTKERKIRRKINLSLITIYELNKHNLEQIRTYLYRGATKKFTRVGPYIRPFSISGVHYDIHMDVCTDIQTYGPTLIIL